VTGKPKIKQILWGQGYFLPLVISLWSFPSDLESLLRWMKRLVFAKPVTCRLTPGSNDYTNTNANPTRPSRHLTRPGGDHRGEITRVNLRWSSMGEITGESSPGEKSPASILWSMLSYIYDVYLEVTSQCVSDSVMFTLYSVIHLFRIFL